MEFRNAAFNKINSIDCEINHPEFGWIPFTASQDDVEALGVQVFYLAQADAAPYAPSQEELNAEAAYKIRFDRDQKLVLEVDPIAGNALRWAALTDEQRQAWADYRQALLDVPQQAGFPNSVTWPEKP